MQERGFRPTNFIYEAKVAALCVRVGKGGRGEGGDVDAAVKLIVEEMEGNCVPNVRAYNRGNQCLLRGWVAKQTRKLTAFSLMGYVAN